MSSRGSLTRLAYFEYKVTRQISTGNGETFLATRERPPGGFARYELGFGIDERPCSDCYKPCTLDYTLGKLDEINRSNLRELNLRDPTMVPDRLSSVRGDVRAHFKLGAPPGGIRLSETKQHAEPHPHHHRHSHHRMTVAQAQRELRAQAKRGGMSVVRGQWMPNDPNRLGRGGMLRRTTKNDKGRVIATKTFDLRAKRLIARHRAAPLLLAQHCAALLVAVT